MKIVMGDTAGAQTVKIALVEGSKTRFVSEGGTESLEIGYGKEMLSRRKAIIFLRKILVAAKQNEIVSFEVEWAQVRSIVDPSIADAELGEILATALLMAEFEFNTYKEKKTEGYVSVEEVFILGASAEAQAGIVRGVVIGGEINATRILSNTPGGDMTPTVLALAAKTAIEGTSATVRAMDKTEMQSLGMGAVLGIAKGSKEEPKFIIVEYWGTDRTVQPLVLVGKGVTFDTGGLNIKTGDNMYEMHMDMSGGAAVIHAVALAAKLGMKVNVIALVPAVENAPGADAVRPGDILKSLSGKTVEVLNTDAEGRVILADGITYAKKYNPIAVVDVATLTGAALVALGTQASAFMTNEMGMTIAEVMALGEQSGDYLWPFPAWEEYEEMTKGHFGDVPNISTAGNSRYGGVIAGGMFLKEFAKELGCLWIHIDMAPRMTSTPGENLAKGAAGAPVRLLLKMIEQYAK